MALSNAERQQQWRERRKAKEPAVHYRKPTDRRARPQRWADAVQTLYDVLDGYQAWRDSLPPGIENSATADRLDAVLDLRELVDQLEAAELPKGFGRD